MIKFKGAYKSATGEMLEARVIFCDGVSPQAATDAIGDMVARLVQHAVAVYGDEVNPEQLIAEVFSRANDVYPTLPEITEQAREYAVQRNDSPDPEPELRQFPSGDDEQVLTCGLSMRVNGYEVLQQAAGTESVPFDGIPLAAAGVLGALTAHSLTGAVTPANILSCEEAAVESFKDAWEISMPTGKLHRAATAAAIRDRRMARFISGELDEEN